MANNSVDIRSYVRTQYLYNECVVIIEELGICIHTLSHDDMVAVAKQIVGRTPDALKHLSSGLKDNKEVVLAAVNKDGCSLRFASLKLRDNKEVVLAAVEQSGMAISYVSDRFRSDKQILLIALKTDDSALSSAPTRLKNNLKFMLEAVAVNRVCLSYASSELRDNKQFVLAALNKSPEWILKREKEDVFWTVKEAMKDIHLISKLSDALRDDEEVIMEAVKYYDGPIKSASERIQNMVSSTDVVGIECPTAFEKLKYLKMNRYKSARK